MSQPRITAPVRRSIGTTNKDRAIGYVQGEPVSQPWGLREFSVLDLERNRLTFGQTFE